MRVEDRVALDSPTSRVSSPVGPTFLTALAKPKSNTAIGGSVIPITELTSETSWLGLAAWGT